MPRSSDPNFWPHGEAEPPLNWRDIWLRRVVIATLSLGAIGEVLLLLAIVVLVGYR